MTSTLGRDYKNGGDLLERGEGQVQMDRNKNCSSICKTEAVVYAPPVGVQRPDRQGKTFGSCPFRRQMYPLCNPVLKGLRRHRGHRGWTQVGEMGDRVLGMEWQ